MSSVSIIEGIGPEYQKKLNEAGVYTIDSLLKTCATKKGRERLSEETVIPEKLILKWTNHADLSRIKGVGGEYAELLEAAGADTVVELATRKADKLYARMAEMNAAKNLVRKMPTQNQVVEWIDTAKILPRILQY